MMIDSSFYYAIVYTLIGIGILGILFKKLMAVTSGAIGLIFVFLITEINFYSTTQLLTRYLSYYDTMYFIIGYIVFVVLGVVLWLKEYME